MIHWLFFSLVVANVSCWSQFAEPLVPATPNKAGVYEFDLYLDFRLSMTIREGYGALQVVDFEPETGQWTIRSASLATACNATMTNSPTIVQMDSLIQLFGLHRKTIAINGKSPGQAIVVPHNAEILIRVHNQANEMSLHMHGQRNTWFNDGVSFLQQCPINLNGVYSYRFIADTAGTHWYHGHLGADRAEGILGPLIVMPESENIRANNSDSGREYAIIIQHLTTMSASDLNFAKYSGIGKWGYGYEDTKNCWRDQNSYDSARIGGSAPIAGILINDKGWHKQDDILARPNRLPLETFRIKQGETIRLRLINAGISQPMMVHVVGHQMTLVAADGYEIQPVKLDFIILTPGERYDIMVAGKKMTNQQTHWIIIETLDYYSFDFALISPTYTLAKLFYEDVAAGKLTTEEQPDFSLDFCRNRPNGCLVVNCPFLQFPKAMNMKCVSAAELQSLNAPNDPQLLSDHGFSNGFQEHVMSLQYGNYFDGYNFKLPRSPPYFHVNNENAVADWCDRSKCRNITNSIHDNNCYCFYHLNITLNSIVQLTIANFGPPGSRVGNGDAHPFHLHGEHFYLMKMAFPTYAENNSIAMINTDIPCSANAVCNTPTWGNSSWSNGAVPEMNTVNPSYRDSVVIPVGGYVVLRFRATNPGWFFAHCHVLMHNMGGMAFALRVGRHEQMPVPPATFPRACGIYEAPPLGEEGITRTPVPNRAPLNNRFLQILTLLCMFFLSRHQLKL